MGCSTPVRLDLNIAKERLCGDICLLSLIWGGNVTQDTNSIRTVTPKPKIGKIGLQSTRSPKELICILLRSADLHATETHIARDALAG